jgi:hypothetical protein
MCNQENSGLIGGAYAAAMSTYADRRQQVPQKDYKAASRRAASILAELMRQEIGSNIEPAALRKFLAEHWTKVSRLGHAIHEGID